MKKHIYSIPFLTVLVLILGSRVSLSAQQPAQPPPGQPPRTQPSQSQPAQDQQQASPPTQAQPEPGGAASQPPDTKAQSGQGAGQTFTGTITKTDDKYVLKDADGRTYDIDNQDAAKRFEGKIVNIHGTLDPNGKMIHVQ
jgi:hypothetical protein